MVGHTVLRSRLVARDDELHALSSLRRAAAQGRGALALIGGEAGIGKSGLVAAFRESLSNGRAAVGVGLCREFGTAPYAPVLEALRAVRAPIAAAAARDRAERLAALVGALESACARRFVVVVLEDVHWADDGTLRFLAFVLPTLASMRLLIVATYRTDAVANGGPVASYIARFARERLCRRIELQPLGAADTRRMLLQRLAADQQIARAALDEIVERSEGNPFFAEELLKSALERREGAAAARGLPLTIRASVVERLAGLGEGERAVAEIASVLGRRFDARALSALTSQPLSAVFAALRRLRDLQLIEEDGTTADGYAFRHALTREAIADTMLSAELRPLHARILRMLEQRGDAAPTSLGYHAWAAHEADACRLYNERAGDEADAAHVYPDAVRYFERAMRGAADDRTMAQLLAKAGASSARDGAAHRAADFYEAAALAAERCGDAASVVEHYQAMSVQARVGGDNERAMTILERALRALPDGDRELRARLGVTLAMLAIDRGDLASARGHLARCEGAGVPSYDNALSYAALVAGDPETSRRAAARYVERCAALGEEHRLSAEFNAAFGLVVLGCDDEAFAAFERLMPALHDRRLRSLEVLACANAAIALGRRGRLAEARALIERGAAIPEPATTGPVALAAAALDVARAQGDDSAVEATVTPAVVAAAYASRITSTLGRFAGPYARWLAARGRYDDAASGLRRALATLTVPVASTDTLLAAAELGDPWTRQRAIDLISALDAASSVPLYAATAAHLRALDARARGLSRDLRAHALEAARRYAALGWPLHEARASELAGEQARARTLYERAGAHGELARFPIAASCEARSVLSRREHDIAALVAAGTPNKVLAERFAVNQRTIEKHLTSIYAKLGLRSRSERAAAVGRGLLAQRDGEERA